MRHTLWETWSGLRRNLSMTIAVVMTMWVSLTLFGIGLLSAEQVDLIKGRWYDKIEITVFLCVKTSHAATCDAGADATAAQRTEIEQVLKDNPEVKQVYYESKAEAYAQFREVYKDSPILSTVGEDDMQDSFRVKLQNPEEYEGVVSATQGMKGVENIQDLHKYLDPLFTWLNMARWATIAASVLLLAAAALQIGNTIRMAAFNRRRELGIMRLVGASNWYILLPFLLEAIVSALVGALFAFGTLAALEEFVIKGKAALEIKSIHWVDWPQIQWASGVIALVAVVLAIVPTLVATRRFLKV
ncbi:MAG: permease-like cell division protein FtsX [Propionibacteriaceae bacterium]|jgi:cell division transport system permease protein|nr:permease-like cell division protein FtsX [Propionibacteriaceae bacterium]